ncbi:MAG: hypothetical protein ACYSUD_12320 [Planctomycetota bacterium]|jgi:hypothetical protein
MFKDEADFEKVVGRLDVDAGPNPAHREELRRQVLSVFNQGEREHATRMIALGKLRRMIMKNTSARIAAAAVIVIGLGMAVYVVDKATAPVWAIEQSIEAMKNYRCIHFAGTISVSWDDSFKGLGVQELPELPESQGEFEVWARADEQLSRSSRIKMVLPNNVMISVSKLQTYIKLADGVTYDIKGDLMRMDPWPTSEMLSILKEDADSWTELRGRDAATGKERIFVEYSSFFDNRFYKFEFDSESKLLVSFKQWEGSNSPEGPPRFDIRKIVFFEQLPDEIFGIDLPEASEIIPVTVPIYDPNYGMSAEGLTQHQACRKILTEFWQKVHEQDFDGIRRVFPYSVGLSDEVLGSNLGFDRGSVELLEIGQISEGTLGPVAPCTVRLGNGKLIIDMIVMFREIDGKSSCVVHSNKGEPRPLE